MQALPPGNEFSIQAFHDGNESAFGQVYDKYYGSLYRFTLNFIEDELEAEDTVTESFVKLSKRRQDFKSLEKIWAFLYVATRNACLDLLKKYKTKEKALKELGYLAEPEDPQNDSFLVSAEVIEVLHKKIEDLPDMCRKVFTLSFFEGLSNPQVAERLDISTGNVQQQKRNAILSLRATFLKKGMPPD